MTRFTKAVLLFAALSVMVAVPAFAISPILHPGDLVGTEDFRLLGSGDVDGTGKHFISIIAPNVGVDNQSKMNTTNGWWYGEFGVNATLDQRTTSASGYGASWDIISNVDDDMVKDWYAGYFMTSPDKVQGDARSNGNGLSRQHSFDKFLIRTVDNDVELGFNIKNLSNDSTKKIIVGLMGGYEIKGEKWYGALANDCTLGCKNFHHEMHHSDPIGGSETFTGLDTVRWTGKGDELYYVECCDNFALVASNDRSGGSKIYSSTSKDFILTGTASTDYKPMVFAHLSEVPHLRVRVAMAENVLDFNDGYLTTTKFDADYPSKTASRDFRIIDDENVKNPYWKHVNANGEANFQVGAVDVPDGESYNLGVLYADKSDCKVCGTPTCDNGWLPVAAVTNLGIKATDISANYGGSNVDIAPWLCNSWCGLCTFDEMMSGDKGSLADGKYGTLFTGTDDVQKIHNQSALFDCVCHIYPAFSSTFKAKGNVDIDWTALRGDKTTHITGRFNTSWIKDSSKTGGLCDTCAQDVSYWYPCPCLELYYKYAINRALLFALDNELKPLKYTNKPEELGGLAAGEYGKLMVEFGEKTLKDKNEHPNITLTKVVMKVDGKDLSDAGLMNLAPGEWWRTQFWNKMALKLNGIALDENSVESWGSAAPFTADKLSFLSILQGPQSPASDFKLEATDDVTMGLFVFVMDSDEKAVRYYEEKNTVNTDGSIKRYGNKFLVVFDGARDNKFTLEATLCKKGGSEPMVFALEPDSLVLNLKDPEALEGIVKAVNVPLGGEVEFSIVSPDLKVVELVPVSGDAFAQVVKALKAGEAKVRAEVKGTDVMADASVVVKDEVAPGPTPHHGGGGGCTVGFAPALLLLLAPLAFLKK